MELNFVRHWPYCSSGDFSSARPRFR